VGPIGIWSLFATSLLSQTGEIVSLSLISLSAISLAAISLVPNHSS
jgi:hypothetical protein